MADLDIVALRRNLTWHEHRAWLDHGLGAKWPDGELIKGPPFPDACGDCGRHEAEHPIPNLPVDGETGAQLVAEVERLSAAVALHQRRTHSSWAFPRCEHCGYDWPCPTVRVSRGDAWERP